MSTNMNLEEKTIVSLYEAIERSYGIAHDSPVIGAYEIINESIISYGLYGNRDSAQKTVDQLIKKKIECGYEQAKTDPYWLFGRFSHEIYFHIKSLEVDKLDIAKDGKGNLYYKEKQIL